MSNPPPEDDQTVQRPLAAKVGTTAAAPPRPRAADAHGNALPMGIMLGDFELTGILGEGGFGIVYLAQDHRLERRVALKEYMPAALARRSGTAQVEVRSGRHRDTFATGLRSFVNEAKLLARFEHPSLVKVYHFWEANGTAYMVMPYYEGATLKEKLLAHPGPPDEAWLMALLGPLTEALAFIHGENCYHRDISPDNVILLAGSEKPILLDFGAARRVIGDMTHALTVILKQGYAPVEQYAESVSMKQGPWTDVYGLAALVYFAVVGKPPPASVSRLMGDQYVPMTEAGRGKYSERFLRAIDDALKVRPDERTQNIEALREALGLGQSLPASQPVGPTSASSAVTAVPPGASTPVSAAAVARSPAPAQDAAAHARSQPLEKLTSARDTSASAGALVGSPRTKLLALATTLLLGAGLAAYLSGRSIPVPSAPAPEPHAAAPAPELPKPAVVEAAPPAAPEPFSAQREFDKLVATQTPGFQVQAIPARERLRIGRDQLRFKVTSSQDGFLTVLLAGPDGSLLQLFPNTQVEQNRIAAGQTLDLPHPSWRLETAPPTGSEHFLVIVSKEARDYSAFGSKREYYFLQLPTGEAATQLAARSNGRASWLLGGPGKCSGPACDAFGAAQFKIEVVNK